MEILLSEEYQWQGTHHVRALGGNFTVSVEQKTARPACAGRAGQTLSQSILKPPGQIELQNVVIVERVQTGKIQVVAAGAEIGPDAAGVAVTDGADHGVGEAVSKGGINALLVGPAFKEVRVQQIYVQRILFNMLPVSPRFPRVLFGVRTIDQALRGA